MDAKSAGRWSESRTPSRRGTDEHSTPKLEPQGHAVPQGLLPGPTFGENSRVRAERDLPNSASSTTSRCVAVAVGESWAERFVPGYRLSRRSSRCRCSEPVSATEGLPKRILTLMYISPRYNNKLTIAADLHSVLHMWKSGTITCLNEGHRQHHVFLNTLNFSNLTLGYCSH